MNNWKLVGGTNPNSKYYSSTCKETDCKELIHCKGVCRSHYMRVYRQKPLQVAKRKLHHKEHYLLKKDEYRTRRLKWDLANPEKRQAFTKAGWIAYREKNKEKYAQWLKDYNAAHKKEAAARANKRRAAKLSRTPKWLTKEQLQEIKDFYKNCPDGYHVDHIIPLQGKKVSGLHVPWNLQYLTPKENLAKYNKLVAA